MLGSPLAEVVLTLLAVYGGLAAVCSAAGEWVAAWRCWRPKVLTAALREMLAGACDTHDRAMLNQFLESPLVRTLTPPDDHGRGPSYLPAWAFTETVLRLIKPPDWEGGEPITFNDYTRIVQQLPDSDFKAALETIGRGSAHDIELVRKQLGAWFESVMDRASGWYKRRMVGALFVIAAVLCLILDVDTLEIARSVWATAQERTALTAHPNHREKGRRIADASPSPRPAPGEPRENRDAKPPQPAKEDPTLQPAANPAHPPRGSEPARTQPSALADNRPSMDVTPPSRDSSQAFQQVVLRITGLGLSAIAIVMVASFGFQIVTRFLNVRLCGPRPR